MSDLPTLDFSLFTKGDEAQSKQCAQKIVQSFRDHGFVKLTNHGIPEETVKTYMGAVSGRDKIWEREGPHALFFFFLYPASVPRLRVPTLPSRFCGKECD
jgi:hypothetical protein